MQPGRHKYSRPPNGLGANEKEIPSMNTEEGIYVITVGDLVEMLSHHAPQTRVSVRMSIGDAFFDKAHYKDGALRLHCVTRDTLRLRDEDEIWELEEQIRELKTTKYNLESKLDSFDTIIRNPSGIDLPALKTLHAEFTQERA